MDIRKLVSGSQAKSSQPPLPPPKEMPQKKKPLEEVKTPYLQQPVKELVVGYAKIEIPVAVAKTKVGRDLETSKTTSSKPSLQRKNARKMKKEPSLELEEEEESTEETGSSGGD